jgi:AcrR family transcriptional regulator
MYSVKLSKEEQLREEIVLTAQQLFQQFGLHKTTMEDIAKAMRRGKSTLYYYYKNKEEVFEAVILKEIDEIFFKTHSSIEKLSCAENMLKTYFSVSVKTMKRKVNLYKIIRSEMIVSFEQVKELMKKYNGREIQSVKEILLMGIENGEFSASLKENVDILAYSTVSAMRSLTIDLATDDKYPNWDERLNLVISIFIKGLKS